MIFAIGTWLPNGSVPMDFHVPNGLKVNSMRCPYCESGTNDFVPMNQAVEYSGIEMAVNRQGMLRVRVLDDDGGFTTQDIIEIRNCPLCGKRFMKGRCV